MYPYMKKKINYRPFQLEFDNELNLMCILNGNFDYTHSPTPF